MAPRRPPASKRPPKRAERDQNADASNGPDQRNKRPPRRGKDAGRSDGKQNNFRKGGDAQPRRFSSEPRRGREPDPNSPFAVLAALKANMTASDTKPE
jgi:ATP-dependent RNA helicase SUPV3L1/SUV3